MKKLANYILTRIEPTLHAFELDGYDKTLEHFERQLEIILNAYFVSKYDYNTFIDWAYAKGYRMRDRKLIKYKVDLEHDELFCLFVQWVVEQQKGE